MKRRAWTISLTLKSNFNFFKIRDNPAPILSVFERDRRTVFVKQLAARLKVRELIEFFTRAGRVRDAKIVTDKFSGRSKG